MEITTEFLSEQLRSKGIRPSYQRIKVLEYLYQKGGHPTVDEIYHALAAGIPTLSKVTIYNTLHTLIEAGLVRMLEIDETEKHFDITLTSHGHFQCEACGTIFNFDFNLDHIPTDDLKHFRITQKNVYFKGLCPDCVQQKYLTDKEKEK